MNHRTLSQAAAGAACALALLACGGGAKQADSPGTCPEGTLLKGEDCLPVETASTGSPAAADKKDDGDKPMAAASAQGASDDSHATPAATSETPHATSTSSTSDSPTPAVAGGKAPYDKDAVEVQLKRAARQIKANCGSATDDEGKATGPWGSTRATVVLGRNGHIKQTTIPAPYDGKPVGVCVQHAFEKLWFPPYAAPNDVSVEWEIVIAPPKKH